MGRLWQRVITTTSEGNLGGRGQNERIELPGKVETDGIGTIKKPPENTCRDGCDRSQMAAEIITGELPQTPRRPPKHSMKDRFEVGENPCDRCKWWNERATDFPCSHCTHNNALPE